MEKYTPKEITRETNTGIQIASFEYYDGLEYVKEKGLKFGTSFAHVSGGTGYIVCCGDVMARVN